MQMTSLLLSILAISGTLAAQEEHRANVPWHETNPPFEALAAAASNTLKTLDSWPAYTMNYNGNYALDTILKNGAGTEAQLIRLASKYVKLSTTTANVIPVGMGCTGFTDATDQGDAVFGHNEDWEKSSFLVLATKPQIGYASITIMDASYLGKSPKKEDLAVAPYFPLSGVNSQGVAIATYSVPKCDPPSDNKKKSLFWPIALRAILDKAKDIDEAVNLINTYNITFTDGNKLQFLIGDATGRSCIVEWLNKETIVIPKMGQWQAVTNFIQFNAKPSEFTKCNRYKFVSQTLSRYSSGIQEAMAMSTLSGASDTRYTQFSVVYNLAKRTVNVVFGRNYKKSYSFNCNGNAIMATAPEEE